MFGDSFEPFISKPLTVERSHVAAFMALSVWRERIVFSGLLGLGSRRRGCRICHRWHLSLSVWCHRHPLNTTSAGATFILSPRENAPSWLGPLSQVKARFVAGEAYSDSQHPRLAMGGICRQKGPVRFFMPVGPSRQTFRGKGRFAVSGSQAKSTQRVLACFCRCFRTR